VRNDVWDVVPRPVGKSVVTSRWLYKTKIAADGSVEKHKAPVLWHEASHRLRESTMMRLSYQLRDTLLSGLSLP
jgi:hypothetical protein